ncbi:hypothetical protein NQZ68_031008 [Dissostichus eleginoides]|nr:hypothetical protein NQZ68_031008 [Dissostichus eleginoides]
MRIEKRNLTWTLIPLFLAGVFCNTCKVIYQQQPICAVKGSSVIIPCSFYCPEPLRVKEFRWVHAKSHLKGTLIYGSNFKTAPKRFHFILDNRQNCSLKIHPVEQNDAGKYMFRFTTNPTELKWTRQVGSTLKVVDLKVSVTNPDGNRATQEGDSLNLTCTHSCDGGNLSSAFTWFKNGEHINEGSILYLSNMSSENTGNYICSLKTHTGATSGAIYIDVEYGPKNTSVSVSPSMEVDAGTNVSLICSSHANPPVENYTWFRVDANFSKDVGHQPVFFPDDGGKYLCCATNKHGSQKSSVVVLKIKAYWTTLPRDVLIITAIAVLLIVIALIAIRRFHKASTWTTETGCEEEIQDCMENTDYVNWLSGDTNQSQEGHPSEGGAEVIYTTVYFYPRNTEQQMDFHTE